MANTQDWTIKGASLLLEEAVPGLARTAHYYATSDDQAAVDARHASRLSNPMRPFHVFLYRYLNRLQYALQHIPTLIYQSENAYILAYLLRVLDLLENDVIVAQEVTASCNKSKPQATWLNFNVKDLPWAKSGQKGRIYKSLRSWVANSRLDRSERLQWLLSTTCLAGPTDQVKDQLLDTVNGCVEALEVYLPVDITPLEDDDRAVATGKQHAAWQKVQDFCNGMEIVHRQLDLAWSCNCTDPHENLHFAFDPCGSQVNDHLASSISQTRDGWRQMSLLMRYSHAHGETPSYIDFCEDLNASPRERSWYTTIQCENCDQPVTLEQLLWQKQYGIPSPKQRLCMAVMVSHLYLHLGGGKWWPYEAAGDVVRFQRANNPFLLPITPPLFLYDTEPLKGPSILTEAINPHMPSLVEFGKLLLEIVTWKACSWVGTDLKRMLRSLQDRDTDLGNADRILTAIMACIGYQGNDCLKAKEKRDTIRSSEKMRSVYFDVVIRNLECVLLEAYKVDVAMILSTSDHAAPVAPIRAQTSTSAKPALRVEIGCGKSNHLSDKDSTAFSMHHTTSHLGDTSQLAILNDDSGNTELVNVQHIAEADSWLARLDKLRIVLPTDSETAVKIAILDTGLHFDEDMADHYDDRYQSYCFLNDDDVPVLRKGDEDGHGTHIASIILDVGTDCKVYSARICRNREEVRNEKSFKEVALRVAKAIRYAVDHWEPDIISLSFGFRKRVKVIEQAVKYAYDHHVLVIAAAGNQGGLQTKPMFPARDLHVMCIHAATGYGNMYYGNPTKKANDTNFAILGVAVEGCAPAGREPSVIRRSGTSQATAIAAGVAALVMQMMRDFGKETEQLVSRRAYTDALSQLRQLGGMRKVFEHMSSTRGDYNILEPWRLVENIPTTSLKNVRKLLCSRILGLMDEADESE